MADIFPNPTTNNQIDKLVMEAGNPQAQQPVFFNYDKTTQALKNEIGRQVAQGLMERQIAEANQQAPAIQRGLLYPVEKVDAMIQGRPEESVQQELAQQQPRMTLNQLARQYAADIIRGKALWDEGAQAGNEQVMQLAHNGAEQARAGMQQLGYDPQAYGLNGDLAAAQQGLAKNDLQALQNILAGDFAESSGANYRRNYQYLLEQGFGRSVAERIAGEQAELYADKRRQSLIEAFHMYGRDDTTINPMGVQLLQKIAEEDIPAAESLAKQFAGPLNEYGKQNAIDMAAIQHKYKGEDRAADQHNRLQAMDYQAQLNAQLKSIQAALDSKAKAQDFQYRVMLLDRQAQLKAMSGGNGSGSNGSGVNAAQIKVWQEEVKRADDWDKEHLGEEKNNPYRASANAYKAMIDQSQGLGQSSSGAWAEYGDVPNDFNAFGNWVDAMFNKNAQDGYPKSNAEIIAIAEGVNKEFADHYIDDSYRKPVKSETAPSQVQPKTVVIPANEPIEDYGLESGQRGSWGNIIDVNSIVQGMRQNPQQTEAGRMAARRYGR